MTAAGASRAGKSRAYLKFSSEDSILLDDEEMGPATPKSVASNNSDEGAVLPGNRRRRLVLAMLVVGMALVVLFACTAARGFAPHGAPGGKGEERELAEKSGKLGKPDAHVVDMSQSAVVSLAELPAVAVESLAPHLRSAKATALRESTQYREDGKGQSVFTSDVPGAQFIGDGEDGKGQSLRHSNAPGSAFSDDKAASLSRSDFPGAQDDKAESIQESNMPGVHMAANAAVAAVRREGTSAQAAKAAKAAQATGLRPPAPWKEAAELIVRMLV